jgi:chemotaxis protein MotC
MMRAVEVLAMFALLGCAEACAQPLADLVRDLNTMQNRMVAGDQAARDQAARQFNLIEKEVGNADPASWMEERHARAAIIYLLCGGAAGGLRGLVDAKRFNEALSPLLSASLLYADGDPRARDALMAFDARQYPAMLGAHLALVQGGSLIGTDNSRAIALLDLARLLMPGSLVEEAALRREISALDPARDEEKIGLLAIRYAAKYASSPFARHFWELFPNIALAATALPPSRVDLVLDKAPPAERLDFYLALSRRSLLAGNFPEADAALAKIAKVGLDPQQSKRLAAYRAVVSTLRDEQGVAALRRLDSAGLPGEDARLVKLAASVGAKLDKTIDAASTSSGAGEAASDDTYDLEENVRKALAQTDELLKTANRR